MFYFESTRQWRHARTLCHKQESEIAIANNADILEALANQRKNLKFEDRGVHLGLDSKLRWVWLDGENVSNTYHLWGPKEPSGDGTCGSFLNAIRWDSSWRGYGWRWNDQSCSTLKGFICEEPLGMCELLCCMQMSRINEPVIVNYIE